MTPTKILIVEDEGIVALDVANQLRHLGYQVVGTLAYGEAAVNAVPTLQPDLILMDIRLKGRLDGILAAQTIRASSQVPIIFVTAYADSATVQRMETVTDSQFLIKPFKDTELAQMVRDVIRSCS